MVILNSDGRGGNFDYWHVGRRASVPPMFTRMDIVKMLSVGSRKGVYNIGSGDGQRRPKGPEDSASETHLEHSCSVSCSTTSVLSIRLAQMVETARM